MKCMISRLMDDKMVVDEIDKVMLENNITSYSIFYDAFYLLDRSLSIEGPCIVYLLIPGLTESLEEKVLDSLFGLGHMYSIFTTDEMSKVRGITPINIGGRVC